MAIRLLRKPVPLEQESLTSYLVRLARENCSEFEWLRSELKLILPKNNRMRDYNCIVDDNSIKTISVITGLAKDDIKRMTVEPFSFGLWEIGKDMRWADPYYFEQYILTHKGKYCVSCLRERLYHKIIWQLKPIKVCLKHNTVLIEKCSFCGNKVTVKNISEGMCTCGTDLRNVEPIYVHNPVIIDGQNILYSNFGIKPKINSYFMGLEKTKFLKFFEFLSSIIKPNLGLFSFLGLDTTEDIVSNLDLKYIFLIENVLTDWPMSFFKLLDEVNEIVYVKKIISFPSRTRKLKAYTPVFYISASTKFIREFTFFRDAIIEYLTKTYNIEFFLNVLKDYLYKNEYIDTSLAEKVFNIKYEVLKSNFGMIEINSVEYIKLKDIVEVLKNLINYGYLSYKANIDNFEHYTSFKVFCKERRFKEIIGLAEDKK